MYNYKVNRFKRRKKQEGFKRQGLPETGKFKAEIGEIAFWLPNKKNIIYRKYFDGKQEAIRYSQQVDKNYDYDVNQVSEKINGKWKVFRSKQ